MSRPSTHKPTAGRAAEGVDRTMQGVYRRLPENIRLLMAKYDIDPAEVAAALNIAKRTYNDKRRNPWSLSLGEIEIIAKALRTDPATLMYGEIVPVDMSGISISA